MKKIFIPLVVAVALIACKKKNSSAEFLSPEEGANVSAGSAITLKLDAEPGSFDSIQYLVDTSLIATKKDTAALRIPTTGMNLGARLLTARVYTGGETREVTTNILLLPAQAPLQYTYKVVNSFPHDTTSFTEGLEYHDGFIYESDGGYADLGGSSLRKAELRTGKVLQKVDLDPRYFAEGITVIGDKIVQLTYKEGVGFVYDKNSFKKLSEFQYTAGREGWGLCFDGTHILNTDGTNNIYLLNKDTYQKEATLEVYDSKGPVDQLNELEFINGKIYANVWQKDIIVIIDPNIGAVEGEVDLKGLLPETERVEGVTDVLNGIAWDAAGKRLFVTGKKWNKLFQIEISQTALAKH